MQTLASPYGFHRVLEPQGVAPQAATRLNSSLPIASNEILIEVHELNLDSTSFKQIAEKASQNVEKIKESILSIVRERGKMHNPVTNSGGMLIGKVLEIGKNYQGSVKAKVGDKIATLVSLTLTPLHLDFIVSVNLKTGQIKVKGHAILFESGIATSMPSDIPEKIVLAALDVCGAPALVFRHARENNKVLFVGAGKSAKLSAAALKGKFGDQIQIHALDISKENLDEMKSMGLADEVFVGDATLVGAGSPSPDGETPPLQNHYDLVINVANVPHTEMTSIMAVKEKGTVIFFSMATDFSKVALGAEGIGKDATFLIGNGYVEGHAGLALDLLRKNKKLKEWFEGKYLRSSPP